MKCMHSSYYFAVNDKNYKNLRNELNFNKKNSNSIITVLVVIFLIV